MPVSFPVTHEPTGARGDRNDPWAELRRYEQAKADGTAPEASFDDLLDVINPLQHIPIVSTIYREITGDTIQGAARIVGGGLYGGVGGLVGGLVNAVAEEATGRDLGEHVMVAMGLSEDTPADGTPRPRPFRSRRPTVRRTRRRPRPPMPRRPRRRNQPRRPQQTGPAAAEPRERGRGCGARGRRRRAHRAGRAEGVRARHRSGGRGRPGGPEPGGPEPGGTNGGDRPQHGQIPANPAPAASTAADRTAAELQTNQQANAAPDRATSPAATAPTQFMALGDRGALINHRARTNPAALAAESDRLGHRRLQGDPRAVPTPATAGRPTVDAPAGDGPSSPAATTAPPAGGATPDAAAARGDLAERMMRALNKYEALRRDR
ncbi:MAG: hypothetical protein U5L06_14995 [Rhodovibrio sp.]|nr:hypothetical protein [Rhodovibrio sp.]